MFLYLNSNNFILHAANTWSAFTMNIAKGSIKKMNQKAGKPKICYKKQLLIIYILIACFLHCTAQFSEVDFEHYTVTDGLSDNNVTAVYQDGLGYVWAGTENGLNNFDGQKFKHFFTGQKPLNLPGMYIVKIVPFSGGRMGVVTRRGLQVINAKDFSYESYRFPDTSYFAIYQNALLDATELPDKSVLLCSRAGIYSFDKPGHLNFRYDEYPSANPQKDPLAYLQAITMLNEKEVLVYKVNNGLDHYDANKKKVTRIQEPVSEKFTAFFPHKIFGTTCTRIAADQFIMFDRYKDSLTFYNRILNKEVTSGIPCMLTEELNWESKVFMMNDHQFAISCSRNGYYLFHLDKQTGIITCDTQKYLPSFKCNNLMIDRDGILWVGTRTGLLKQKQHAPFINSWLLNTNTKPGFSLKLSSAYRYKDKLYVGSFNRFEGLLVVDTATMQLLKKITFYGGDNGWSEITSVQCYHKDTLWVATTNGVLWLDVNSNKYGCVLDNKKDSLLINEALLYPPDKRGRAWICELMNGKVGFYDTALRTFTFYTGNTNSKVPFVGVKHIVYDDNANTWIAGHGLSRWNNVLQYFDTAMYSYAGPNKFNDDILAITADKKGSLWLFNTENVLLEYKTGENKFYEHSAAEGLPEFVQAMANDVNDNLWFTTGSQLVCYNISTKKIIYFDHTDGLPLERSSSRSIFFDKERNCFYSLHNNYLAVFSEGFKETQKLNKQLQITEISMADTVLYNPAGTISLNYQQNNFSLHFTVLDYDKPGGYNFFYRIDKKEWVNLGSYQVVFFNSLSAGNHKIEIKATGKFGEDVITGIGITVSPPFWQTWWFITAVIFLIATMIWLLYRYRLDQLKKFFAIREKISRELHDEVGSTLSGISMYSHLAKEQIKSSALKDVEDSLNIMQHSAGEMVNKLNDIVWLINPRQDTLQKLIQRLEEYAADMAMIKKMQVKVNIPEYLNEINLPMQTRRNIYLFCKEAINNAVKYSNATLLQLNIKEIDSKLEFSVIDNGKGFNKATVKHGNGLDNMRKRADEISAKLNIESKQNEGTFVSIQCRIT